jgi:peptidyl-prolyl cis-trans isomerase D
MLDAIRRYSSSIVVKLLMALLIFSFAAWGIGDVIRTGATTTEIAEVGGAEITPAALSNEIHREVGRLRQVFGDRFTVEQARAIGIADAVLARVVNETLIDLAARDLGVAISDDLVRQRIHGIGALQGVVGGFDRARFQLVLQNAGMTEEQFVSRTRAEMSRAQLVDSLDAGAAVAPSVVDALYRQRQERRLADVVVVADASMSGIGGPDEATIARYHQDHAASFTAPEYRTATVVRLEAGELAKEIAVSDAEIKEAYESRLDEFRQPERRRVEQFVVADEAAARGARARIAAGEDFARVAKEAAGAEAGQLEIGTVARDQLLPELAEAAFRLDAGGVGEPVHSPLGWHLVRVAAIEPARQQALDEAREGLRSEIAREKAIESLYRTSSRLEDALGGGASVEDVGAKLGLPVARIGPVDGQGNDPNGVAVAGLPPRFLETAFATAKGADSGLVDAGGEGFFVLRVDGVTPAALRPLDQVRAEVVAAWTAERRAEAAKKAAEALVERVNGGADLAGLAKEMNLTVAATPPLRRAEQAPGRPPEALVQQIFKTPPGRAAMARGADGFLVAQVKRVTAAEPGAEPAAVRLLERQLREDLRADLRAQLAAALRARYPVTINRQNFERLF